MWDSVSHTANLFLQLAHRRVTHVTVWLVKQSANSAGCAFLNGRHIGNEMKSSCKPGVITQGCFKSLCSDSLVFSCSILEGMLLGSCRLSHDFYLYTSMPASRYVSFVREGFKCMDTCPHTLNILLPCLHVLTILFLCHVNAYVWESSSGCPWRWLHLNSLSPWDIWSVLHLTFKFSNKLIQVGLNHIKSQIKSLSPHLELWLVPVNYWQAAFPGSWAQCTWFHNGNPQAQWQWWRQKRWSPR